MPGEYAFQIALVNWTCIARLVRESLRLAQAASVQQISILANNRWVAIVSTLSAQLVFKAKLSAQEHLYYKFAPRIAG